MKELVDEWHLQQQQEELELSFLVYSRAWEAWESGDDFNRGWESVKRQILGHGVA